VIGMLNNTYQTECHREKRLVWILRGTRHGEVLNCSLSVAGQKSFVV